MTDAAREAALAKAAQDFVDKVDRGEARSTKSYAAFKAALSTGSLVPASAAAEMRERCESEIIRLTKKWGNPIGSACEQAVNDHGHRLLYAIRQLDLSPAGGD